MVCSNKLGAMGVLIADAMNGALDGLSPSAAALLLTLHDRPAITITELALVVDIAQPTAVRVLDGLVRRGWLERRPRIGRITPLRLTGVGKKKAQSLQAARLRVLDQLLSALPGQERLAFERALDTMLAAATTSRAFAQTTCRFCDHPTCVGSVCPVGTRATELEQQSSRHERN